MAEVHSSPLGERPWSRSVLEELWARHRGYVGAVLLSAGARSSELEDLAQDVALAWVDRHREIRDAGAIRGWLRSVARNAVHQAARRRGSRPEDGRSPLDAEAMSSHESPGASTGSELEAERVLRGLAKLPEDAREVLVLRGLRGLSQREIAETLGIGVRAVESRLARARKLLRAQRDGAGGARVGRSDGDGVARSVPLEACNGVPRGRGPGTNERGEAATPDGRGIR